MMRIVVVLAVVVLFLGGGVGCGGKILEREEGGGRGGVEGAEAASTQAPTAAASVAAPGPSGTTSTSGDPCEVICEGNGGCVGGLSDCYQRCTDELRSASCAAEASAYLRCYAARIEGCTILPPACEPAYCAFTRCAGKRAPSYCP